MKKDIMKLPFDEFWVEYVNNRKDWEAALRSKTGWLHTNKIKTNAAAWILPQAYTLIANMKLNRNSVNMIDGVQFWKDNVDLTSDWWKGFIKFILLDNRSYILGAQTKDPYKAYNSLVPLVLASHKMYNGTKYSEWDYRGLRAVVNPRLCDAMVYVVDADGASETKFDVLGDCSGNFASTEDFEDFEYHIDTYAMTPDEILSLRDIGLKGKSPQTYHSLSITGSTLDDLPTLAKVMCTQIWCAHPANVTKYSVTSPSDWDRKAPPLIMPDMIPDNSTDICPWDSIDKENADDIPWKIPKVVV